MFTQQSYLKYINVDFLVHGSELDTFPVVWAGIALWELVMGGVTGLVLVHCMLYCLYDMTTVVKVAM